MEPDAPVSNTLCLDNATSYQSGEIDADGLFLHLLQVGVNSGTVFKSR